MIINENNYEKARKAIKNSKEKIFTSNDDDLNRKILEKTEIKTLLINLENRKDYQKQRNSGFNQVLAKIAKKNNITIGINLDEIIEAKNKHLILARIQQNIFICKKNKLKMKFIQIKNKRNIKDLKSLGSVLGMPTSMTKFL